MTKRDTGRRAPGREVGPPITYEGTTIRQRGAMLNLTDMWKAAEAPQTRRPSHWLALEETIRFRDHASAQTAEIDIRPLPNVVQDDISGIDPDGFVLTTRGNGGGTWAHWQLALAYAKYLSPAFHLWCNDVVRTAMERSHAPVEAEPSVMRYLETEFQGLHRRLDTVDRHAGDLMFLLSAAQELLLDRRRDFSERSQSLMCATVADEPYEGRCPCCGVRPVLGANLKPLPGCEFDHFFHRGLNKPENGWLICRPCHSDLTTGGYLVRFTRMPEFRAFQAAVLELRRCAKASTPHD